MSLQRESAPSGGAVPVSILGSDSHFKVQDAAEVNDAYLIGTEVCAWPWSGVIEWKGSLKNEIAEYVMSVPLRKEPVERRADGGVSLNYEAMEPGRPYPFQVDGHWLIGVLRPGDEQATIYCFPDDD